MKKHYQKYCNSLTYIIVLTTCSILFSTKTVAQEDNSLSISESTYVYMKDQSLNIYPTMIDTIIATKRPVLFANFGSVDRNEIIGSYSLMPIKYRYARKNDYKGNYIENELVDNSKGYDDYSFTETIYSAYKKDSTGKLYIIGDSDLKQISNYYKIQDMLQIAKTQGYKVYSEKDGYYPIVYSIKTKTCEVKLDSWTYSELKLNPNYFATLDSDQIKIAALVNQTKQHSINLNKYSNLYYVQRKKMSAANINAWKNATNQALPLFNKIYKLKEKYNGNFSFTLLNKSNLWDEFVDDIGIAKGILGM